MALLYDLFYTAIEFFTQLFFVILAPITAELPDMLQTLIPGIVCSSKSIECDFRELFYVVLVKAAALFQTVVNEIISVLSFVPFIPHDPVHFDVPSTIACSSNDLASLPCSCSVEFSNLKQCNDAPTYSCVGPDDNGDYHEVQTVQGQVVSGAAGVIYSPIKGEACPHSFVQPPTPGRRRSLTQIFSQDMLSRSLDHALANNASRACYFS